MKKITLLLLLSLFMFGNNSFTQLKAQENYGLQMNASSSVTFGKADMALDSWTVEMWAKKTGRTNHATILAGDNFKLNLETYNSGNKVGFTLIGQTGPDKSFAYVLPLNMWTHIAYVYNNGTISLFINGEFKETQNHQLSLPMKSLGLGGESFIGEVDEIRVWKTARTADELKNNLSQSVNPALENNLLAYWYFDDQAETVTDISANGVSGNINNAIYKLNTNNKFTTNLPEMSIKEVSGFHSNEFVVRPGSKNQEVLGVKIITEGILQPLTLSEISFNLEGTTNVNDVVQSQLFSTNQSALFSTDKAFGTSITDMRTLKFTDNLKLFPGVNYLWLAVDVADEAADGNILDATLLSVKIGEETIMPNIQSPAGRRLITSEVTPVGADRTISLIPKPVRLIKSSEEFTLNEQTKIITAAGTMNEAEYLAEILRVSTGYPFPISTDFSSQDNAIILTISDALDASFGIEGYTLKSKAQNVVIEAKEPKGLFWGIQTLRQLLPPQIESRTTLKNQVWTIPGVTITDNPRFWYRGFMLDVSRHFFPVSTIKRTLDMMALYKLNIFHFHLTDDQGWRVEIKKYPKLTEVGAWRTCDGVTTGGFYTQEEIKEIVDYAAKLHIDIIPEIDLPGHMLAGLASYPNLGCTSGPGSYSVTCNRGGIYSDILCGGKAETYTFLEDVLTEIMELFPYEYIHIGGDEADKGRWNTCEDCKRKIAELGITGANQTEKSNKLQKYMTDYFIDFLAERGRKLIGWNEVIYGGIPEGVTVQHWISSKAEVLSIINSGHDVIMSDYHSLYLAQRQSNSPEEPPGPGNINTLDEFYNYEAVYPEVTADKLKHILGVEGCMWTEWIEVESHLDYMISPRTQALAEMAWTPKINKNYSEFLGKLDPHYERWNVMGYNYRWNVKPQVVEKSIETCEPTIQLSATNKGRSYFWNDESFSKTRSIEVSEPGIYKCYVDYNGLTVEEIYNVSFLQNETMPAVRKTENANDQTVVLTAMDESLAYRWYAKDENGLNLIQLGQNITLPGSAQLDSYYVDANRLSDGVSSLRLNNNNGQVILSDGKFMNNATAFSFEAWVKVNEWREWGAIFTRRLDNNAYRVMLELGKNGELYLMATNGANANGKAPTTTMPVNTWTHVAFVYDGSKTQNQDRLKLYINGAPITLTFTGTVADRLPSINSNLRLGRGDSNLTADINVSDVRVWNIAISEAQIVENMYGLKSVQLKDLESYYTFGDLLSSTSEIENPLNPTQKATVQDLMDGYVILEASPAKFISCGSPQQKVTEVISGLRGLDVAKSGLIVYPNPNNGAFILGFDQAIQSGGILKIFNLQGQAIFMQEVSKLPKKLRIELPNIPSGIYLVKFTTNDFMQKEFVTKFVIE